MQFKALQFRSILMAWKTKENKNHNSGLNPQIFFLKCPLYMWEIQVKDKKWL